MPWISITILKEFKMVFNVGFVKTDQIRRIWLYPNMKNDSEYGLNPVLSA